ncbi:MAG: D-aminoacyl-tRNA deacylase [Candidatus Omnitrophota bacterium]
MRVVLQRVEEAAVAVGGRKTAAIKNGLLLLVGFGREDTARTAEAMAQKIVKLRVFEDDEGKMNLALADAGGEVLSVPQFTLLGRMEKGNRPGFDAAARAEEAKELWAGFNDTLRSGGVIVAEGVFGAHMKVSLVNDGPVTFVLDSSEV